MAEEENQALKLESWIGKQVTVNLLRVDPEPGKETVGVEGFLQGVDPMGIIMLYRPQDVTGREGGRARPHPDMKPRYAFYPWRRIELIERIEAQEE